MSGKGGCAHHLAAFAGTRANIAYAILHCQPKPEFVQKFIVLIIAETACCVYVAVLIVTMLMTCFLVPTRRHYDPDSVSVMFVHLLCFAIHIGTQFWVTFIAGKSIVKNNYIIKRLYRPTGHL